LFKSISNDLLIEIFLFLNYKEICNLSLVSKNFYKIYNSNYVWRVIYLRIYSKPKEPKEKFEWRKEFIKNRKNTFIIFNSELIKFSQNKDFILNVYVFEEDFELDYFFFDENNILDIYDILQINIYFCLNLIDKFITWYNPCDGEYCLHHSYLKVNKKKIAETFKFLDNKQIRNFEEFLSYKFFKETEIDIKLEKETELYTKLEKKIDLDTKFETYEDFRNKLIFNDLNIKLFFKK